MSGSWKNDFLSLCQIRSLSHSTSELKFIVALEQVHDTFVITDEAYEHIVYHLHKHTYIALLPIMFERTICTVRYRKRIL